MNKRQKKKQYTRRLKYYNEVRKLLVEQMINAYLERLAEDEQKNS